MSLNLAPKRFALPLLLGLLSTHAWAEEPTTQPAEAKAADSKPAPLSPPPASVEHVLRIGTIAPPGSSWSKQLRKMASEVKRRSKGALRIKLIFADIAGDEADVLRMIEEKKLDGAGLTGVGIGKIAPAYLVQQLPWLFRNYRELDCLRERMGARFDALLAEKGYEVLAHSDVGFVYAFTRKPVRTPEDLEKMKFWGWELDVIAQRLLRMVGVSPVKLPVPEVGPALEKGELEAFYGPAYGVLAIGWNRFAKYRLATRLALVSGALLVPKSTMDALPEPLRELLRAVAKEWGPPLSKAIRAQNKRALAAMEKAGIELIRLTSGENSLWVTISEKVQAHFVDKLYPQALLDDVKNTIAACRKALRKK